jgi:hypothetical protein
MAFSTQMRAVDLLTRYLVDQTDTDVAAKNCVSLMYARNSLVPHRATTRRSRPLALLAAAERHAVLLASHGTRCTDEWSGED